MKVVLIGGVAAGTKVAAKLKREDPSAEVLIYTQSEEISYAGCGLPYYLSGVIQQKNQLIINTPESFEKATQVKVYCGWQAIGVNPLKKQVTFLTQQGQQVVSYDRLVIATGAKSMTLPIEGSDLEHVYTLRTPQDAFLIADALKKDEIKRVCIVGAGFIGLEIAENLHAKGVRVFVIESAEQILTPFDLEMAQYVQRYLDDVGIVTFTKVTLEKIEGDKKVERISTSTRAMKCDAVIYATGIRANTEFLEGSGIELYPDKTIRVNEYFETSCPDIFALGDCVRVKNRMTGENQHCAMGSIANLSGRLLGQTLANKKKSYRGSLNTAIVKLNELAAARTGLNERQAQQISNDSISCLIVTEDKASYYPASRMVAIKLTANKKTGLLLGAQVIGFDGVDKIIDVVVMALSMKATVTDLLDLDFAYAPPFSTAMHPLVHAAQILQNKIDETLDSINPIEWSKRKETDFLIDASKVPTFLTMNYLDYSTMTKESIPFGQHDRAILICNRGRRAYLTQNRLKHLGYTKSVVLEGGSYFTPIQEDE